MSSYFCHFRIITSTHLNKTEHRTEKEYLLVQVSRPLPAVMRLKSTSVDTLVLTLSLIVTKG